jgi:hypothetical protein
MPADGPPFGPRSGSTTTTAAAAAAAGQPAKPVHGADMESRIEASFTGQDAPDEYGKSRSEICVPSESCRWAGAGDNDHVSYGL